jgi:farnesyl diphosphate synthase
LLKDKLAETSGAVQSHLEMVLSGFPAGDLSDAMAYATRGGKRLRAFLVTESAGLHDIPLTQSVWPAAAIECLHAYSLVHDDLPCMDDDDLRRGQPTVHKKWNDATAVLAGDALQSLAFELTANQAVSPNAYIRSDLVVTLAHASGAKGMVYGQALDIAAEKALEPLTLDEISHLQAGKTGALIKWAACAGARLAGADISPLETYSEALGLAFQIADDILDVEGDETKAGKRLNKDELAGKATYVSLLGLDGAKIRAKQLVDQAETALAPYGHKAETLKEAARFAIARSS